MLNKSSNLFFFYKSFYCLCYPRFYQITVLEIVEIVETCGDLRRLAGITIFMKNFEYEGLRRSRIAYWGKCLYIVETYLCCGELWRLRLLSIFRKRRLKIEDSRNLGDL